MWVYPPSPWKRIRVTKTGICALSLFRGEAGPQTIITNRQAMPNLKFMAHSIGSPSHGATACSASSNQREPMGLGHLIVKKHVQTVPRMSNPIGNVHFAPGVSLRVCHHYLSALNGYSQCTAVVVSSMLLRLAIDWSFADFIALEASTAVFISIFLALILASQRLVVRFSIFVT